MKFKIEKNVPMPPGRVPTGRRGTYPLREMEVGDSFVVRDDNTIMFPHSVQNAVSKWGIKNGKQFTTRTIAAGVLRVWRVK